MRWWLRSGNAREFKSGRRQLSAYLGLTGLIRAICSGGKSVMLGISKRRRSLVAHSFDPWRPFAARPQPAPRASARALGGAPQRGTRTQCGRGRARKPERPRAVGVAQPRPILPPWISNRAVYTSRPSDWRGKLRGRARENCFWPPTRIAENSVILTDRLRRMNYELMANRIPHGACQPCSQSGPIGLRGRQDQIRYRLGRDYHQG